MTARCDDVTLTKYLDNVFENHPMCLFLETSGVDLITQGLNFEGHLVRRMDALDTISPDLSRWKALFAQKHRWNIRF